MADKRREEDYAFKLLVEGPDDLFVIAHLRELNQLEDNIFIKPCGSVEKAIELFRILIDKQTANNRILGLVIDADLNIAGRWQRISQILVESGKYTVPDVLPNEGLILFPNDSDDVKIGVWVMPDNQLSGMLEDFLAKLAVNDKDLLDEVDAALEVIEHKKVNKYKAIHKSKARIHTFLAWQEEPGVSMGSAIAKSYLRAGLRICLVKTLFVQRAKQIQIKSVQCVKQTGNLQSYLSCHRTVHPVAHLVRCISMSQ